MKIGIFDSGLGGLAILKDILKLLPQYDYVFLGDNARTPYGGRSPYVIYEFTKRAIDFLIDNDCRLVIVACNTASAVALRKIQQRYLPDKHPAKKVLGVIRPTVEAVVENGGSHIAVIGTYATIRSNAFPREIRKILPAAKIYQKPTPLLVPIIEEGEIDWIGTNLLLKRYLKRFIEKNIDTLVLGCTHYGLIQEKIRALFQENTRIISQGNAVAEKLKSYLKQHSEIEKQLSQKGKRNLYVTDMNQRYRKVAQLFLKNHFGNRDTFSLIRI